MEDTMETKLTLVLNPPDFENKLYEDPKDLYYKYVNLENEIQASMENIRQMTILTALGISSLDPRSLTPTWVMRDKDASLKNFNDTLREHRRASANLSLLLNEIQKIKDYKFKKYFMLTRPDTYVKYLHNGYSNFRIYESKEEFLNYNRSSCKKEEDLAKLKVVQYDPEKYVLLANLLRFHGFKPVTEEFKVTDSGDSSEELIFEIEGGKWVMVRHYYTKYNHLEEWF